MRLCDIIETYISGDWGNDAPTEDASCPVSCIRGADIVPIYNSEYNNIPLRYISEKSLYNRALKEGDIVIEKSGGSPTQSTGRVVYISKELLEEKQDVVCSNFCAAFRIKPEWDAKYVYYYLQHIYNAGVFFNFEGKTSGLKNLIMDTAFKSIKIKKIAIETQRSIATVLSTIESKMAANRAINHYLEAMAKQLYDYWFVQFDFPDENGKPYKSSGGRMVWNEKLKREIPLGWDSMTIGDYAPCKGGYAFKSSSFCEEGIPVIKIGNIQEDYTLNMSDSQCIFDFTNVSYFAHRYDLVIAMTGATIGKFAVSQREYLINQRVGRFDLGNNPISKLGYLLNSLKQDYFREQIFQISGGCAQPNISSDQIDSIIILKPDNSLLNEFNERCESLISQQSELLLQTEHLITLRNEILPLLMNGQIGVKQLNNDLAKY